MVDSNSDINFLNDNTGSQYQQNQKRRSVPLVGGAYDTRLLSQRSRLEFHYNNGEEGKKLIVFVPFFENPIIKEKKRANYVDYNPIGRSSSLYAYTGAKSRQFTITTHYTLPHLARFEMGIDKYKRLVSVDSKEAQRSLFTNKITIGKKGVGDVRSSTAASYKEHYYEILASLVDGANLQTVNNQVNDQASNWASLAGYEAWDTISTEGQFHLAMQGLNESPAWQQLQEGLPQNWGENAWEELRAIDTMLFFVNVLRTSVMNNASQPMYGPPIIRIVHGTLFQSVPCVCSNYTLKWDENMGYDLETLTPRRLTLTMNLNELRAGDFKEYGYGVPVARDNLVGWEQVVEQPSAYSTMANIDPGESWWLG